MATEVLIGKETFKRREFRESELLEMHLGTVQKSGQRLTAVSKESPSPSAFRGLSWSRFSIMSGVIKISLVQKQLKTVTFSLLFMQQYLILQV